MPGKKQLLADVLYRTGLAGVTSKAVGDRLLVFGQHRIKPDDPDFESPFADDVFGPTVSEFEAQVAWLSENTTMLSQDDLLRCLRTQKFPSGLSTLMTFDDGYRDNYDLAYPVLKKYGMPAVFFVPSRIIEERYVGWWDVIAFIAKKARGANVEFDGETFDLSDRDAVIARLHKRMQLEPADRTKDLVDRMAEAFGVTPPTDAEKDAELMTWDQLRALSDDGLVTIASHTHSHRVLATLPAETQREELQTSKAFLEERLGRPVASLAYPVGGYQHFTAETSRIAQEVGYAVAYSFCTGYNTWDTLSSYDIKRIGAPVSQSLFVATAVLPEVFDWE
ncbi:MAG: polysaccharide deacetylase family protein [Deltaproteobacteria bacterium]